MSNARKVKGTGRLVLTTSHAFRDKCMRRLAVISAIGHELPEVPDDLLPTVFVPEDGATIEDVRTIARTTARVAAAAIRVLGQGEPEKERAILLQLLDVIDHGEGL
jgi:hypothetical protein